MGRVEVGGNPQRGSTKYISENVTFLMPPCKITKVDGSQILGRNRPPQWPGQYQFIFGNTYVMSHHALRRVSFRLKTRQECFFIDE